MIRVAPAKGEAGPPGPAGLPSLAGSPDSALRLERLSERYLDPDGPNARRLGTDSQGISYIWVDPYQRNVLEARAARSADTTLLSSMCPSGTRLGNLAFNCHVNGHE